MARPLDPRTPHATYKGVTILLYQHRKGWKATYKIHGLPRREFYGVTQAIAQDRAEKAIKIGGNSVVAIAQREEADVRAVLKKHGATLNDAAQAWLSKNNAVTKKATVKELRELWLATLATEGYHHLRSLKDRTRHFEDAFADKQISAITRADMSDWLDSLKTSGKFSKRTIRNIYDATKHLFNFARDKEFLSVDRLSVIEQMSRPKADPTRKEIYTPEQMQRLLDAAWAIASPAAAAMAITAFTAIRTEEIFTVAPEKTKESRLAWEDFRWKENDIYVRQETDKNKIGRSVPLPKNLRKMLMSLKGKGPVYPLKRLDLEYAKIAAKAGIDWKSNAPRHSAITYDMLISNSPAEVANRSGNSIQTIESNYRNRGATKSQARAWFKLMPQVRWGSGLKPA